MAIGKYQQAKAFGDTILKPLTNILREDDMLLGIKYEIATSYIRQGYYFEALHMNEEVYDKQKAVLGDNHPDTLKTRSNIDNSYNQLGKCSEARQLYPQVLEK